MSDIYNLHRFVKHIWPEQTIKKRGGGKGDVFLKLLLFVSYRLEDRHENRIMRHDHHSTVVSVSGRK